MGILFLLLALWGANLVAEDVSMLMKKEDFSFALKGNQALFIAITYGSWTKKLTIEFFAYDPPGIMYWLLGHPRTLLAQRVLTFSPERGVVAEGDAVPQFADVEKILQDGVSTQNEWGFLCVEWINDLRKMVDAILYLYKAAPSKPIDFSLNALIGSAKRAHTGIFFEKYLYNTAWSFQYLENSLKQGDSAGDQ